MARLCRSSSGFTLLELLLVVAIGVVLAAITLPGMTAMNTSYRVSNARVMVVSKVYQARTNALKRNRPAWVRVDGTAGTVQVQTAGPGGAAQNVGDPEFLPAGVVFGTGTAVALLTFDALGRPVNPPQTIQVLYPGSGIAHTVTVSSTGRVTVN